MAQILPIGIDDFRELRERGLTYVDKSDLIRELCDNPGAIAFLLPRPRRFGKSLNLSMLRWYFERREEDLSRLFQGLSIWGAGEGYRAHFQRYPVIYLSFKGIKLSNHADCSADIRAKIDAEINRHRYLLSSDRLSELERRRLESMLRGEADDSAYRLALFELSAWLHHHHGVPAVILIDEYDEPIHAGYVHGYAEEVLSFFRVFLGEGLKGNPHVWKAVLTGILRIARESVFSGLNSLVVYSVLRRETSTAFGFTEPEVKALLDAHGLAESLDDVRAMYDGYRFGDTVMYNPWSILNYIASDDKALRSYWVNTSSNDLVHDMLVRHALSIEPSIEALLEGGGVERVVNENVSLWDLEADPGVLFDLLVFSGYLRAEPLGEPTRRHGIYRLSIPNHEVRAVYTTTFQRWMRERLTGGESGVERLKRAIFAGDAEVFEEQLASFTTHLLSYHDLAAKRGPTGEPSSLYPEQVLHAFVIGLLATLTAEYDVRSNRESGEGRPDLMICPKQPGRPGVVMELKLARKGRKTPEAALREGLAQIRDKDYLAELRARGAAPALGFAVAFDGKKVWVRAYQEAKKRAKKAAPSKAAGPKAAKKKRP